MDKKRPQKGFSLVEFIIYFGIFSFVVVTLITLFMSTVKNSGHVEARAEVQQNLRYVITQITQSVHKATSITVSPSSTLSLGMSDEAKNPTVFDLSDYNLRLKEGSGDATALNSDKVKVTALSFTKISNAYPAKDSVQASITIAYKDNGNLNYQYSQSQTTSAGLR